MGRNDWLRYFPDVVVDSGRTVDGERKRQLLGNGGDIKANRKLIDTFRSQFLHHVTFISALDPLSGRVRL